ncbi:MAG: PEP-CTERM sorting domain-containing protein [Alphaproteobacteria bacterium]|nr:PEP-CTERM sorting domain-containing protein [Alphaproteobacteria bacterium]
MVFDFGKNVVKRNLHGVKYGASILAAVFAVGLSTSAGAAEWVLDFDTDSAGNANAIMNGQIIDNEYASQIFGAAAGVGVTISVHGSRDAVAFPSSGSFTHEDNDLRHTNVGGSHTIPNGSTHTDKDWRNILIIQEDNYSDGGCTSTVCNSPDDAASGGYLKFLFNQAVNLTGMDVFDIDGNEGDSKVYFFNEGEDWGDTSASEGASNFVDRIDLPVTGNHGVGFLGFGDKGQNITMMKIYFKKSGGVDDITGQTDTPGGEVPEPGALAIILTGLLGYGLTRRKRTGVVTA